MIASYYRSQIYLQVSHAGLRITSYRQLRVKDLPKVPTRRLVGSNQRPSAPKAPNTTKAPSRALRAEHLYTEQLFYPGAVFLAVALFKDIVSYQILVSPSFLFQAWD